MVILENKKKYSKKNKEELSPHVENIVLLERMSNRKADTHVKFSLSMEDMLS